MAIRALGRRLLVVSPLVLLPAVLVSCGSADDTVLTARDGTIEGRHAVVQLPDGKLTFTVSDAAKVRSDVVVDGDPDGAYVGVDWEWEPWGGVPDNLSGFLITDDAPAKVSATIDGEDFALGDRGEAAGHYVPADEGTDAGEVTLSVELDGVTQTVRGDGSHLEAGAAAALYDLTAPTTSSPCRATLAPSAVRGTPQCRYGTVRLPYVHDLGWAEDGRQWLVVNLDIRLDEVRSGGEKVDAGAQEETVQVGGHDPAATLVSRQVATALRTQTVFDVPADQAQTIDFDRTVATDGAGDLHLTGHLQEKRP